MTDESVVKMIATLWLKRIAVLSNFEPVLNKSPKHQSNIKYQNSAINVSNIDKLNSNTTKLSELRNEIVCNLKS
jgi:hypothetical protein